MAEFFYDKQVRRFLVQFARILSNWYVEDGYDPNGNVILKRVPVMYGDQSRQVANIINNNSPSNLPTVPQITYWIKDIQYDQSRTQEPYFVEKISVRQRTYNPETREYETTQGQAFTVERIMPVPYKLSIQVDFWTSNYNQKLQLFEQMGVLFNPSMEIQSTDNFIDWTSLSVVYQDGLNWTSRSIPQGTGNNIDIMTWNFQMPIWITSPARVSKLGIIHKVINSIYKGAALTDMQDDDLLLGTRQKVSPYGYKLLLIQNRGSGSTGLWGSLQIIPANQPEVPDNDELGLPSNPDTSLYWSAVLNAYGAVKSGISMITIENPYMENEIMGTITFDPLDDRLLNYQIDEDTLPTNTLTAVDRVVDPLVQGPGAGLDSPVPGVSGPRYIVTNGVGDTIDLELVTTNTATIATGATEIPVVGLTSAVTEKWFNATITARDSSGMSVFSPNTTIIGVDPIANTITISNPTIADIENGVVIKTTATTSTYAWGDLVCAANDIIEWSGSAWVVSWSAVTATEQQFVTNLYSGVQYRYGPVDPQYSAINSTTPAQFGWSKSWEGWYDQGSWNVVI